MNEKKFKRVLELVEMLNQFSITENWFDKGPFTVGKKAVSIKAQDFEWLMSNVEDYDDELRWMWENSKYGNDFIGQYYEWIFDEPTEDESG